MTPAHVESRGVGEEKTMAIYHFSAQVIGRSAGRSAIRAAAYRSGEAIENTRTGEVSDYTRKSGVLSEGIEAPEEAPEWAKDRAELWNSVEERESRKNSQLSKEYNVALPKELTPEQNEELVKKFCKEQFAEKGLVADWAIHDGHRDGQTGKEEDTGKIYKNDNIHAHIQVTLRQVEKDGWSENKYRDGNGKEALVNLREGWAKEANLALEKAGREERIDHRSLKDQGIDREPTVHLGVAVSNMVKDGRESEVINRIEQQQKERAAENEKEIQAATVKQEIPKEVKEEQKNLEEQLKAVDKNLTAIENPEAFKEQKAEADKRQAEQDKEAKNKGMLRAVKEQEWEGTKIRKEFADKWREEPTPQVTKRLEGITEKMAKIDEVLKEATDEKIQEYCQKEAAQNPAFANLVDKFVREEKENMKIDPVEAERVADLREIERIREAERRARELERERENERERGGRGR